MVTRTMTRARTALVTTLTSGLLLAGIGAATPAPQHRTTAAGASPVNPVVLENRQPGTTAWKIPWPGMTVAGDAAGQVKGYASATSVDVGGSIDLKVSTALPTTTTWNVYRLGWYGGQGGRQLAQGSGATGPGDPCPMNPTTGELACSWPSLTRLAIPATWTSGVYLVVLTAGAYQSYVTFTVRDDARSAAVLDVQPVNTYQAYNDYPAGAGKSLYPFSSTGALTAGGTTAAVQVSFNRPYARAGASRLLNDELPLIRYLEERGQDVKYATDVDLDADPAVLRSAGTTIFSGHDEYWSAGMYDAADAARDAGHGLSFFGANDVYWQARYGPSRRSLICWRDPLLDPETDPALKTTLWRSVGRPEQPLQGSMYPSDEGIVASPAPWVVADGRHWLYRGTGLATGSSIANLVSGEVNRRVDGVPGPTTTDWTTLSASPYVTSYGAPGRQEATLYRAPSNALVFTAGTLGWNPALGSTATRNAPVTVMAANVLARQAGAAMSGTARRASGPTRYETATALSAATFAAGSHPTVFVATGENYPDALGASAASRGKGPVLLVGGRSVPAAVTTELKRLQPARIVVVGGADVVSAAVLATLGASTGVTPTRLAGPDRYQTGALLSSSTFAPGVPVAYVATGANFPDALAAGAAGAQLGGPVLLTGATSLPGAVAAELARLKPQRVVVTGGPDVVSDAVLAALASYAPAVTRRSGSDRFATALAVARDARGAWAGGRVVLATGMNFPDALAAGPAVAATGGTLVLLPRGSSLPVTAADEILRNDPDTVLLAGGADTIPDSVRAAAAALFSFLTPAAPGAAPTPSILPAPKDFLVPSAPTEEPASP